MAFFLRYFANISNAFYPFTEAYFRFSFVPSPAVWLRSMLLRRSLIIPRRAPVSCFIVFLKTRIIKAHSLPLVPCNSKTQTAPNNSHMEKCVKVGLEEKIGSPRLKDGRKEGEGMYSTRASSSGFVEFAAGCPWLWATISRGLATGHV